MLFFKLHSVLNTLIALGLCLGGVSSALAQEASGMVKTATGLVTTQRSGKPVVLNVGDPVFTGEQVRTAKDSSVGITLKDDTLISAGPNAILAVEEFSFNQTTHSGGMLISISRGAAYFVTGLLGKITPQNVAIKTPTATVGIRGTEFLVDAGNDNE